MPLLYREARYPSARAGRQPGGRLRHGSRLRLRLDALHRPGAGDRAGAGGERGEPGAGVRLLFVYSLGLGMPFILAAVAIGPFLAFLQRFRRHLRHVEMVMGFFLLLAGTLMIAGPVHEWLQGTHPAIVKNGKWLGLLAAWGGAALLLGLGAWIAGHLRARLTEVHQTAMSLAGLALFTGGVCVWGGSMNGFGVWLIDTFPGLSRIEETFVPKSLQTEIRKQGAGQ